MTAAPKAPTIPAAGWTSGSVVYLHNIKPERALKTAKCSVCGAATYLPLAGTGSACAQCFWHGLGQR